MTPVLVADCVGKAYGGRKVLSSATLRVDAGCITALLGRNGAGKSTLLKIAAGWITPDHGTVHLKGKCYLRAQLHRLANEGLIYLPDRALLSPGFSVREHLESVGRRYGSSDIGEIRDAERSFGRDRPQLMRGRQAARGLQDGNGRNSYGPRCPQRKGHS